MHDMACHGLPTCNETNALPQATFRAAMTSSGKDEKAHAGLWAGSPDMGDHHSLPYAQQVRGNTKIRSVAKEVYKLWHCFVPPKRLQQHCTLEVSRLPTSSYIFHVLRQLL